MDIPKEHARREREALVEANRREGDGQRTLQHNAAGHSVEQLRHVRMARVEARLVVSSIHDTLAHIRVHDTNNAPVKRVIAVPRTLDESLAKEEGEPLVAVVRQPCCQLDQ